MVITKRLLTCIACVVSVAVVHGYAALDLTAIPLGDGKVSSSPQVGYVYSCQQNFNQNAPGASGTGSWIHGTTWSLPEKLSVQGTVVWPNATYTSTVSGDTRSVISNSLPVDSHTGTFPIASNDPAYQVDRNPNTISAQSVSLSLPSNPSIASAPTCVGMGLIGVAVNGVAIFNALDAGGRDAVAHEVQDTCAGHPQQEGEYHYHGPSSCMPHQTDKNTLVGYALDGFGIYSNIDANGKSLTNSDLDECHGITSSIIWDGKEVSMYHYVLTNEYPYTIGCFKGTPSKTAMSHSEQTGSSLTIQGTPIQIQKEASTSGVSMRTTNQLFSNLSLGSKGSDVEYLQNFLQSKGFLSIPEGVSKGYFGGLTKSALVQYQRVNNISPTGYFGPLTRSRFNAQVDSSLQGISQTGVPTKTESSQGVMRPQGGMMVRTPPKEAFDACATKTNGTSCSFSGMGGETVTGVCIAAPNSTEISALVCGPTMMGAR